MNERNLAMKTSISIWSWHREIAKGAMDVPKFLAESKRLGFKAVELLASWTSTPEQMKQTKKLAADSGLKICSYGVHNNFAVTGADLDAQVAAVKTGIENAVSLGAPLVRVFGGNAQEGLAVDKALDMIVDGFRKVMKDAEDANVTLALENHGRLSCTSQHVMKIIKGVGSPRMKATMDIGNFMIADEDPVSAARNLAKETAHVHVKDHRWEGVTADPPQVYVSIAGKKLWPEVVGKGKIDFANIFKILKDAGYKGYLSLEYEGNEPEPEGIYTSAHNLFRLAEQAEQ